MHPDQSSDPYHNVQELVPYFRSRVDWEKIAVMLANGRQMNDIVGATGCSRQTIWRALRRSPRLVERVREERTRLQSEAGSMVDGLRILVANGLIRLVHQGDTRVLLWLADRLKIHNYTYSRRPASTNPADDFDMPALEAELAQFLADTVEAESPASGPAPSTRPRSRSAAKNRFHMLHNTENP
jgi:hypothetical protein